MALARERWEFRAAEAALKALRLAEQMTQEEIEREKERIERIKRQIFGKELDGIIW